MFKMFVFGFETCIKTILPLINRLISEALLVADHILIRCCFSSLASLIGGYKVLHDTAPRYLGPLTRVADIPGRRALRSACTDRLEVPYVKLSTIGGRAFPVAASQMIDLELTTRHSRFGINTAVVPAPIENFFISTILYLLAL